MRLMAISMEGQSIRIPQLVLISACWKWKI